MNRWFRVFIDCLFWTSSVVCGVALGIIQIGGSHLWLIAVVGGSLLGGWSIALKSALRYPILLAELLKD